MIKPGFVMLVENMICWVSVTDSVQAKRVTLFADVIVEKAQKTLRFISGMGTNKGQFW